MQFWSKQVFISVFHFSLSSTLLICITMKSSMYVKQFGAWATVCLLLRDPRFQGKQTSCHSRQTYQKTLKTMEHSKIFQCNSICWFILHIITVFLFNQCLSSYCTVFLIIKKDSLLRILRLSLNGYFETPLFRTFFHVPWDFEIVGFNCTLRVILLSYFSF